MRVRSRVFCGPIGNSPPTGEEFLRRFLLHVLPRGFVRIRCFGFLSNRQRAQQLPRCHQVLGDSPPSPRPQPATERLASWVCPHCGGAMHMIERLTADEVRRRVAAGHAVVDTS